METSAGHFLVTFGASVTAAAVTTLGLLAISRFEARARANSTYFACFAAGVLITVSFLHIVPTSLEMSAHAPFFFLGGYLLTYAFNRFIDAYVCDRAGSAELAIGLVPLLGIGFHSLLDGAIYAIAFKVSIFTGALAATGMILHEFPEGIMLYVLLMRGGFSRRSAFWLAWLAAALTTPLGTLAAYPVVAAVSAPVLGALLAVSAGALVYVGATHLLPLAEREPRPLSTAALVAGILVALGIVASH